MTDDPLAQIDPAQASVPILEVLLWRTIEAQRLRPADREPHARERELVEQLAHHVGPERAGELAERARCSQGYGPG